MSQITVIPNPDLRVLNSKAAVLKDGQLRTYRAVTKSKAGFMVTSTVKACNPIMAFRQYQPKALVSLAVVGDNMDFTVYARQGKKVWASEDILKDMTVGDINQSLYNTCLGNHTQYAAVNAKTWASKAFVMNE
jgi:hypothetical protein